MRMNRLLAKNPLPGYGGAVLSVEQWYGAQDRALRYKQSVDSALAKLGLDRQHQQNVWDLVYHNPPNASSVAGAAHQQAGGSQDGPSVASASAAATDGPGADTPLPRSGGAEARQEAGHPLAPGSAPAEVSSHLHHDGGSDS
jgi:hypothetical protein